MVIAMRPSERSREKSVTVPRQRGQRTRSTAWTSDLEGAEAEQVIDRPEHRLAGSGKPSGPDGHDVLRAPAEGRLCRLKVVDVVVTRDPQEAAKEHHDKRRLPAVLLHGRLQPEVEAARDSRLDDAV